MTLRRCVSLLTVGLAALVLSGCFVTTKNLPAGAGPAADERLIGSWRGFDRQQQKDGSGFLHFLRPSDPGGPLKLVWIEDHGYQVHAVHTMIIGGKHVFAAKILTPFKPGANVAEGYILGFYEVNGDELAFTPLEKQKVADLAAKGRVKGTRKRGAYELSGTPAEIAAFLASPDADAARMDEPAVVRRIPTGKN